MIRLSEILLDEDEYEIYSYPTNLRFVVVENKEYQRGDYILMMFKGVSTEIYFKITYVSHKHQQPGFVVLGLKESSRDKYYRENANG